MHRIDTATAAQDLFGAGKDGFTAGDPGTGTPPTSLDESWFNDVQEELCRFIEAMGITLVEGTVTQLLSAYRAPVGASDVTGSPAIAGVGGVGSGGTGGAGLKGTGGATNGIGVQGMGTGTAPGVEGNGASSPIGTAATTGSGLVGRGGQTNGFGVEGFGKGSGAGVKGTGQTAAPGLEGQGATSGPGVLGTGGATSGAPGVRGVGGSTDGLGVKGEGIGTGCGVYGLSVNGYGVVAESDTSAPAKSALRIVPQAEVGTDPATAPAAGDAYVNAVSGKASIYNGAEWGRVMTRVHALLADEDKSATGQFTDSYTIGANKLRAGTKIRVRLGASVSAYTSGNITLGLRFGGTTIITTAAYAGATNDDFVFDMEITIRSVHASTGALALNGTVMYGAPGATVLNHQSTRFTSQDTTAAKTIDVDLTLSGTATVRLHDFTVEMSD